MCIIRKDEELHQVSYVVELFSYFKRNIYSLFDCGFLAEAAIADGLILLFTPRYS